MSDIGEGRKCAGNTLHCETYETFLQMFVTELTECREAGTEPEGLCKETLEAWDLLVQSAGMSDEDKGMVEDEFRRVVFEKEFKPEDYCVNVNATDVELAGLHERYPLGYADCVGLSDRIGRMSLVILPE